MHDQVRVPKRCLLLDFEAKKFKCSVQAVRLFFKHVWFVGVEEVRFYHVMHRIEAQDLVGFLLQALLLKLIFAAKPKLFD